MFRENHSTFLSRSGTKSLDFQQFRRDAPSHAAKQPFIAESLPRLEKAWRLRARPDLSGQEVGGHRV